jgi:dTDP-4-dehydrorhamnose reductase
VRRVLLLGGTGQLGTAIRLRWTDCEIVAPSHRELALERTADLRVAFDRVRPDVLVNAAAFHDVDRCEEEAERAFAVNAIAVGAAACLARERGVPFVTISTDYVFDGNSGVAYREESQPHPLSIYGMSKLAGEHLALHGGGPIFVVRTCGLYGPGSSSRRPFIERVLAHSPGEPLRVVADVVASPTFAGDLAAALRKLVDSDAYGLYHAVNVGAVSWYDFAREAVVQAESKVPIEPITASYWKAVAVRPRFSALDAAKLSALGIAMPPWRAGIAAYLRDFLRPEIR